MRECWFVSHKGELSAGRAGPQECDSEDGGMGSLQEISSRSLIFETIAATPEQPSWYAVQTRSRHEKTVAAQLQEKGVTTFLPLVAHVHRWSDRYKVVQVPLFPGYAFVRTVASAEAYQLVLRTPGLSHFVGVRGKRLPIPDKEIEDIRKILVHNHPCAPHPFLRAGQRVRIRGGCLDGVEGILLAQNSNRSLVLSVQLIQRSLSIRIEGYDLEPV